MKATYASVISFILSPIIFCTLLTGCTIETESDDDTPNYEFTAQRISIPSDIGEISNVVYSKSKLFVAHFTGAVYQYGNAEKHYLSVPNTGIYVMDIDTTDAAILPDYNPPVIVPEDSGGCVFVDKMCIDSKDNLWVLEKWEYFQYDLPSNFVEYDDALKYLSIYETGIVIRKLSSTGSELLSINIGSLLTLQTDITAFFVDDENIYVSTRANHNMKQEIYVLDIHGNLLFNLEVDNIFDSFIQISNKSVAIPSDLQGTQRKTRTLQEIDVATKGLKKSISVPVTDNTFGNECYYNGNDDVDILVKDHIGVYSYTFGDDELIKMFLWNEIDYPFEIIQDVILLSDNRILCTSIKPSDIMSTELFILSRTQITEHSDKTVLTMATYNINKDIKNAVTLFNSTSNDYVIDIIDYVQYDTGDNSASGLDRLYIDIISGNVPDFLCGIQVFPYAEFAGKGLFADLYTFIDDDAELSRNDFVQAALSSAEIDGYLYQMFPTFYVRSLAGKTSVVGERSGINIEEFLAILDTFPDADIPIWPVRTKMRFFESILVSGSDNFIDRKAGKAYFDSNEFIQLLEVANNLYNDDFFDALKGTNISVEEYLAIDSVAEAFDDRRIILLDIPFLTGFTLFQERYYLGLKDDITFVGYPSINGNGSTLNTMENFAILESSTYKDGAWMFLRTLLSEDWQFDRKALYGFPSNQAAFNKMITYTVEQDYSGLVINDTKVEPPTKAELQADIDKIILLINTTTDGFNEDFDDNLLNIINNNTSDYFNGFSTVEKTARAIQDSVEIYLSERG